MYLGEFIELLANGDEDKMNFLIEDFVNPLIASKSKAEIKPVKENDNDIDDDGFCEEALPLVVELVDLLYRGTKAPQEEINPGDIALQFLKMFDLYSKAFPDDTETIDKTAVEMLQKVVADELEKASVKKNAVSVVPTDKVNKSLTDENCTSQQLSAKGNTTIRCNVVLADKLGEILSEPLNYIQWSVLKAVYSLYDAGNTQFTAAMIYRKMRGEQNNNRLTDKAAKEIDSVLKQLSSIWCNYSIVDAKGKGSAKGYKWLGVAGESDSLISFSSATVNLYGQYTEIYSLKPRKNSYTHKMTYDPLLYELMKNIKHYVLQDDKLFNVKKIDANGKEHSVKLDMQKCAMVNYIIDRITNYRHSNGHMSNSIDIEAMRQACCVEIEHRQAEKRNIDFINCTLEHLKRNGLIAGYTVNTESKTITFSTAKGALKIE